MLKKIIIDNYKSIRHAEIDFNSINILIGENGAGKSNLISFLELAKGGSKAIPRFVTERLGMNRVLHGGVRQSNHISGCLIFEQQETKDSPRGTYDCAYTIDIGVAVDGSTPYIIEESQYSEIPIGESIDKGFKTLLAGVEIDSTPEPVSIIKYHTDGRISGSKSIKIRFLHKVLHLEEIGIYHFSDSGNSSPLRRKSEIDDNLYLRHDGSNLASVLYKIQQTDPRSFRMIEATMQRIAPYFDKFELHPDRINPRIISLEWEEKGSGLYMDATSFSDGTLRFLALAVLLMQPNPPKIIIIDEPELGLHPAALTILAAMIRSASLKSQIIVATQSSDLLNEFSINDVIVTERKDGQSVFTRLDENDFQVWLEDYTTGEIWKKNIIGGQP